MKGGPQHITPEQIAVWADAFADVHDEIFEAAVKEVIRTEEFFPAVGTLYKVGLRRAESRADLAWLMVQEALVKYPLMRAGAVVNGVMKLIRGWTMAELPDGMALWACSQMRGLEVTAHNDQPRGYTEDKRREFVRLYRLAAQNGYTLAEWDGHQKQLPGLAALAAEAESKLPSVAQR